MLGSENLRTFRVDFPVANPDLIDPIHQLRDQIKIKTGAAKSRDLSLRSDDYMRVFNRVIEVVPGHCHRSKLALRRWEFKKRIGLSAAWQVDRPYDRGCCSVASLFGLRFRFSALLLKKRQILPVAFFF